MPRLIALTVTAVFATLAAGGPASAAPLQDAVIGGDAAMVRLLLKAGADPRAADVSGLTALHYAAALGKSKAADALILDGADVDARDIHGITPLHLAAAGGHTAIVTLLVGAGADPDPGFTVDGSALQAARERVQAVVEILLIQQDRESRKERRLP